MSRIVSFRVTEEEWLKIERAAAESGDTVYKWCRCTVLEKLSVHQELTRNERVLFSQIARTQLLVGIGFQMLADDKLTSEEWKKFRAYAHANLDVITDRALADFRSGTGSPERH